MPLVCLSYYLLQQSYYFRLLFYLFFNQEMREVILTHTRRITIITQTDMQIILR
jgi:hypothetical protein